MARLPGDSAELPQAPGSSPHPLAGVFTSKSGLAFSIAFLKSLSGSSAVRSRILSIATLEKSSAYVFFFPSHINRIDNLHPPQWSGTRCRNT